MPQGKAASNSDEIKSSNEMEDDKELNKDKFFTDIQIYHNKDDNEWIDFDSKGRRHAPPPKHKRKRNNNDDESSKDETWSANNGYDNFKYGVYSNNIYHTNRQNDRLFVNNMP
eukprot:406157_1